MVQVFIPSQLTSYTDGASRLAAEGRSIAQVLDDLDRRFPGLKFRVIDEQDRIRRHMRIFRNGDRAKGIDQAVSETDEVLIFGALSGG
ncbi:MAG: molybdopterin synthase sulfur carrier subunit [Phenylobacterium sp.]|uniref:MoaD/ThiS family protein n=1 Tax=Phenylobacterium sp. TaxID=1871053 RepID=UPI0025D01A3F|nr:MoaD/ThiS family protein [Phenylobacterium sp.]MBA4012519.1 molybdopterin synthase sulfur carrier subunit [Phenylobacterium sp.]